MLSILIPTYNYNVFELAKILNKQAIDSKIEFEIIVLDDGSIKFHDENNKINELEFCSYEILKNNMGRSAIRNFLAKKANFDNLLFLDSDTFPIDNNFITNYCSQINKGYEIIYGGIKYQNERPKKTQLFRWKYGFKREAISVEIRKKNPYLRLLTLNFMIKKTVFEKVSFNENIPNLRHEDTLFSYELKNHNIQVDHIENPVYHLGLDEFDVAIKKENESLIALKFLIENKLIPADYIGLSKLFYRLKKLYLISACAFFYEKFQLFLLKNLASSDPSLFIFDLYRLGYLCKLEKNQ
jgi:glycosyltransferase involved in cell wall biosynthesis